MTSRRASRAVKRYRLMVLGKPVAPWRATLQDAQADAIAAGMADWDPALRVLFVTVPAEIVFATGPAVPPRPTPPPEPAKRSFRQRRPTTAAAGRSRPPGPASH